MSPSTNPKRQAAEAETRCRILTAAMRLFTRKGYFNASVRDIVAESGLSTGAVYHHFLGKEAIAEALQADSLARMLALVEEAGQRFPDANGRGREIVRRLFELTESAPELVEYVLYTKHRDIMPGAGPVCSAAPFARIIEFVSEGIRWGEIRDMEPTVAAALLFGGPFRLVQLRLDGVEKTPLPELLEQAWDCAWRGVAA